MNVQFKGMQLQPVEVTRNITLLKSYLVNDPDGRWRALNQADSGDTCQFEVVCEDPYSIVHTFHLYRTKRRSRWWIDQEKDQWVITEYLETA